jgi:hypothetical protein
MCTVLSSDLISSAHARWVAFNIPRTFHDYRAVLNLKLAVLGRWSWACRCRPESSPFNPLSIILSVPDSFPSRALNRLPGVLPAAADDGDKRPILPGPLVQCRAFQDDRPLSRACFSPRLAFTMSAGAPEKFAVWMATHEHRDPRYGFVYRYHPRSDAHSIALCRFILEDLLEHCTALRDEARSGRVVYGINYGYTWKKSRKTKTLDLAVGTGTPDTTLASGVPGIYRGTIKRVRIACETKTTMTEHSKSQPRIYDELSSSHGIVHAGDRKAIATGIAVINIADTFVSPLRQKGMELHVSRHQQPRDTKKMVRHLRGLPVRDNTKGVGFDAYATVVVNYDNQGPATLWTDTPAPQRGDPDHYQTFLGRISAACLERFAK